MGVFEMKPFAKGTFCLLYTSDNMLLFTYQRVHNAIDKGIEDEKLW